MNRQRRLKTVQWILIEKQQTSACFLHERKVKAFALPPKRFIIDVRNFGIPLTCNCLPVWQGSSGSLPVFRDSLHHYWESSPRERTIRATSWYSRAISSHPADNKRKAASTRRRNMYCTVPKPHCTYGDGPSRTTKYSTE